MAASSLARSWVSAESTTVARLTSAKLRSSSLAYLRRWETRCSTRSSSSIATLAYSTFSTEVGSSPICWTRLLAAAIGFRISCAMLDDSSSMLARFSVCMVARSRLGMALEPLGPLTVPVVVPGHAAALLVLDGAPEATVEGTEGEAEHGLTLRARAGG